MKLFIFKPCGEWCYCGGLILVLATDYEAARLIIHSDDKQGWIRNQESLIPTCPAKQQVDMRKELEVVKGLSPNDAAKYCQNAGVGEEYKDSCGHYW